MPGWVVVRGGASGFGFRVFSAKELSEQGLLDRGGLAAQKFAVRLPSFWGWFLCGLVLGEFCYSRRGICLEHFRDVCGLV